MANFPETATWVSVGEIENTDRVEGFLPTGEYGDSNVPHAQHVQRTAYLKDSLETNYYTKQEVNALVQSLIPTGAVMYTGQNSPPPYWYYMQGYWFLKTAYPELWASVQDSPNLFNVESASTLSFQVIDISGYFIRPAAKDDNGKKREDQMQAHQHTVSGATNPARVLGGPHPSGMQTTVNTYGYIEDTTVVGAGIPRIGTETHPKFIGMRPIICIGRKVDTLNPPSQNEI